MLLLDRHSRKVSNDDIQFWGSHIQTATPRQFRNSFRNSGFRQPPAGGPADARVSHSPYIIAGSGSHTPRNDTAMYEKADIVRAAVEKEELGTKLYDPERDGTGVPKRPFLLSHAVMIGLAMALVVVVEMACVAKVWCLCWKGFGGKGRRFADGPG